MASGKAKSTLLQLLVLLAILAGGGAYNYHRNLDLEQAEQRPYRTLSDADLATLLAATEAESERLDGRYEQARGQGASRATGQAGFQAFESAQRRGRAVREMGYQASEMGASLAELRSETARREADAGAWYAFAGDEWRPILRRVFHVEL
ncbi:MAG: hypothetical protein AAF430_21685 [Myxococcota bacterium]